MDEIDARHDIQKNADGSWTANGHMPLEDLVQYVPLPAALVTQIQAYWAQNMKY